MRKKILLAGESWTSFTTHVKGFDTFYTSVYEEGVEYIGKAIEEAGYELTYIQNHYAPTKFPYTVQELKEYACVILSDIGANTLQISQDTFTQGIKHPDRCESIKNYVLDGGALLMVGGYMSFSGIDAKARYGMTQIKDVLPVTCLNYDDREEHPEGVVAKTVLEHPALEDVSCEWPALLGYNKTLPKEGCTVPVIINGDPLIAFGTFGKGKSAVFTSDCAPHWGPKEFVNWESYNKLWKSILDYITN